MSSLSAPYFSVVAASRNDDHGGDPLTRTQIFVNNFLRQCERRRLSAELIIVDWNPVPGRPGLAAVLTVPTNVVYCKTRVITVPAVLHNRLKYADKLPFFQMLAKNVGIRRARGQFTLATNIDIIFSDELMSFIARQRLNPRKLYRVDRYDIKNGLSVDCTLGESIQYAWDNPIRVNRRYEPKVLVDDLYGQEIFKRHCSPNMAAIKAKDGVHVMEEDGVWQIHPRREVQMTHLHTNACGDFTLLSREGWCAIRGYPEFEAFSFNIDSIAVIAAHYAGYQEISLLPPCVCFHIEHGIGSGWTPEGEKKLFGRLREAGILNPEWPVLTPLVEEMREQQKALEFNHAGWGMADFDLPEQAIGNSEEIPKEKLEQLARQAQNRNVSAIQPAYDLDRLTLAHERQVAHERDLRRTELGFPVDANPEKIVLYVPDSRGAYSEARAIARYAQLVNTTTVIFQVGRFPNHFPLRFDPCQCAGLINIQSIVVFDSVNQKAVWELDGRNYHGLEIAGTALWNQHASSDGRNVKRIFQRNRNHDQPLTVISTGVDPQLIFPRLNGKIGFPLIVSIELKLIPCGQVLSAPS
jgi:hypothetical protein